jgi:hypothetical protein
VVNISVESRIKPRIAALGCSLATLALLAGCSKAALSEASNGGNLAREVALRVDAVLKDLEAFVASVAPVKPDLRDARSVEAWLSEFRHSNKRSDPWALLKDLTGNDPDAVCANRGWTRDELLAHLKAAREQLHALTSSIAAGNNERSTVM